MANLRYIQNTIKTFGNTQRCSRSIHKINKSVELSLSVYIYKRIILHWNVFICIESAFDLEIGISRICVFEEEVFHQTELMIFVNKIKIWFWVKTYIHEIPEASKYAEHSICTICLFVYIRLLSDFDIFHCKLKCISA